MNSNPGERTAFSSMMLWGVPLCLLPPLCDRSMNKHWDPSFLAWDMDTGWCRGRFLTSLSGGFSLWCRLLIICGAPPVPACHSPPPLLKDQTHQCAPHFPFHVVSLLLGGESRQKAAHIPLRYELPHRLFIQVVPGYYYQTSHSNKMFLCFELKERWHDRLAFSYFSPCVHLCSFL